MVIEFDKVSKTYLTGLNRRKKNAVIDFSLDIQKGEILGIVGINGAGKSTILKMLMGFVKPDRGLISILGKSPSNPVSREKIGYLPENPYFYDHLTADELLRFSTSASGVENNLAEKNIERLLKIVGLFSVRKQKLRSYSKGMTQRAGLCFALVHDPEIVILDEPMSGLDPLGRKMVADIIFDLKKRGKTVLFCSHILNDVEQICDRVLIMDRGRLKKDLSKNEIMDMCNYASVIVNKLTDGLIAELKKHNCEFIKDDRFYRVECGKDQIEMLMSLCRKEGVAILSIDYATNNMEKIFLKEVEST